MGKAQRDRGAAYEREVCHALSEATGLTIKRVLGQARDGGHDIEAGPFLFECKRRKGIAVYEWLGQVEAAAARLGKRGIVIARADGKRSIVVLPLETFVEMAQAAQLLPARGVDS